MKIFDVSVWVLQEADVKMEFDIQEIYWKCLCSIKGMRAGQARKSRKAVSQHGPLCRTEGRQDWIGRASDYRAVLRKSWPGLWKSPGQRWLIDKSPSGQDQLHPSLAAMFITGWEQPEGKMPGHQWLAGSEGLAIGGCQPDVLFQQVFWKHTTMAATLGEAQ